MTYKSLETRLTEHNEGNSYWTKRYKPWKMVYYESFFCKQCAESREKFFKTGKGRKLKDLLVKHNAEL
ncbi:GIY-YIG nuclease family protein [Candidatus Parcubacteria bacterium]|nr:GIY-YIG nuclease family protein [Candidatus Parcubacteria bacterium]